MAPPSFVTQQVERANAIFAPYDIAFEVAPGPERDFVYSGTASHMESRADRDALSVHVGRGAIHCFVVASLRDVDEPERMRRGVHWHASQVSARPGAHYIILSAISEPFVLAHELGHFLGNRTHSETRGNLMSYERSEVLPFLDAAQQRRLHRAVRAYLRSGELKQVPKSAAP